MRTVHMIGNAHLDPVWLWGESEGADAVLATARSACDLLAEFPALVFTCSGSWFHQVIERRDERLFERVRRYVGEGRWQPVGGMVIQPDCNLPLAESMERQLTAGQGYFRRAFGRPATVGYNVDSFGHGAYLPRFVRQAGMDCYVFMRPGPREMLLPAGLFRWQSPDGEEVTAFRIAGAYTTGEADLRRHVESAVAAVPERVGHTMCFFGVGDHGGGPTRAQIEWILRHAEDVPGCRLVLSHPRAFFDAVAGQVESLPVVVGELQHHAIGCYSVQRRLKVAMRRAEAALIQAGHAAGRLADHAPPEVEGLIEQAWEPVLFNQFHDVLGGTSIGEAARLAAGELAAAEGRAERLIALLTRRAFRDRAQPGAHALALFNPAGEAFEGAIVHEPWFEGRPARGLVPLDEEGRQVPHQWVEPRAKVNWLAALLFEVAIPPGGLRLIRLAQPAPGADRAPPPPPDADPTGLANRHLRASFQGGAIRLGEWTASVEVHRDESDTWSHSHAGTFPRAMLGGFPWREGWQVVERGPVRSSLRALAEFDRSRMWTRAALLGDSPRLHLRLSVVWSQVRQRLVLRLTAPAPIGRRVDLVPGGPLERPADGKEYPLAGGTLLQAGGSTLAVVAPEVFSISADPEGASLTLLRSPFAAHHDPAPAGERPDTSVTDQGEHEFEIVLWPGAPMDPAPVERLARQMLSPPIVWDLTG